MCGRTAESPFFLFLTSLLLLSLFFLTPSPVVGQSLPGLSQEPTQEAEALRRSVLAEGLMTRAGHTDGTGSPAPVCKSSANSWHASICVRG